MPRHLYKSSILACALTLAAAGCAQTPQRDLHLAAIAQAEQAILEADRLSAAQFARTELRAARTKLNKAKSAQRFGDPATARRLAQQAWTDARLATARAQAMALERRADALRKKLGQPIEQARWSAP